MCKYFIPFDERSRQLSDHMHHPLADWRRAKSVALSLLPWRKFWVGWAMGERPQLIGNTSFVEVGSISITLAEDQHADISVEVDLARLGADEPVKNQGYTHVSLFIRTIYIHNSKSMVVETKCTHTYIHIHTCIHTHALLSLSP